jgi:porphobilinogen deaminase
MSTNALRRAAYARRLFSEIEVIHFRGAAEREVSGVVNGSCNSPIVAHSSIDGIQMTPNAAVLDEDSRHFIEASRSRPEP